MALLTPVVVPSPPTSEAILAWAIIIIMASMVCMFLIPWDHILRCEALRRKFTIRFTRIRALILVLVILVWVPPLVVRRLLIHPLE